MNESCRNQVQ